MEERCPPLWLHRRADICRKEFDNPWRHARSAERLCKLPREAAATAAWLKSEDKPRSLLQPTEACRLRGRQAPARRESAPASRCRCARAASFPDLRERRHCALERVASVPSKIGRIRSTARRPSLWSARRALAEHDSYCSRRSQARARRERPKRCQHFFWKIRRAFHKRQESHCGGNAPAQKVRAACLRHREKQQSDPVRKCS